MRKEKLVTEKYYHIYNRGVDKRNIFSNLKDVERFMDSIRLFSGELPIGSIRDYFLIPDAKRLEMEDMQKIVSVVQFCLNPNHFHLILKQEIDGGISEFMKRLQGGYTKYFNDKHKRSGSLLQGTFKSSNIEKEGYFELIHPYVMWNNKMHNIPEDKLYLVRSSLEEYKTGKYDLVDKVEAKNLLEMFGGMEKMSAHVREIISILRDCRGKGELKQEALEAFDFHEE